MGGRRLQSTSESGSPVHHSANNILHFKNNLDFQNPTAFSVLIPSSVPSLTRTNLNIVSLSKGVADPNNPAQLLVVVPHTSHFLNQPTTADARISPRNRDPSLPILKASVQSLDLHSTVVVISSDSGPVTASDSYIVSVDVHGNSTA